MPKRKAEDCLWEQDKDELRQRYEENNESLPSIMKHMKENRNFDRTKSQYERKFRSWGFKKKNISREEWERIDSKLAKREAEGKTKSVVVVRGIVVPDEKIKKQRKLYEPSAYQRSQSRLPTRIRSPTPEGIEVFSPRSQWDTAQGPLVSLGTVYDAHRLQSIPSQSQPVTVTPDVGLFAPHSSSDRFVVAAPNPDIVSSSTNLPDFFFFCADDLPWNRFLRFLSALNFPSTPDRLNPRPPTSPRQLTHGESNGQENGAAVSLTPTSKFEEMVYEIHLHHLMHLQNIVSDFHVYSFSPAVFNPKPYLPPNRNSHATIDIQASLDLSLRDTQLELLKYAVFLISNNLDKYEKSIEAIVEFARNQDNRCFLARLIEQISTTGKALAEKLVFPAAQGRNFALVDLLLRHKVYLDFRGPGAGWDLLQLAVERSEEQLLSNLLKHGAVADSTYLDFAIFQATPGIVKLLCHNGTLSGKVATTVTESAFVRAAIRGDEEIFELLVSAAPDIFNKLRQTPWLLFEAAASSGELGMITALQSRGMDIRATDGHKRGSPLTLATYGRHFDLVKYLVAIGVEINGYAQPDSLSTTRRLAPPKEWPHWDYMAAIHAATYRGQADLVRYLLDEGADPNQPGTVYPIQIAAIYGYVEVTETLLCYGANPISAVPSC